MQKSTESGHNPQEQHGMIATRNDRTKTFYRTLDGLQDFVVLLDMDLHVVFLNRPALKLFRPEQLDWAGRPYHEVFASWPMMIDLISNPARMALNSKQLSLSPDLIVDFQVIKTPDNLFMLFMHDITSLVTRLDSQEKFLRTIIHDLRSPLSAIMGYTDLFDRVGSVTEQQEDFLQRLTYSAKYINTLLDDVHLLVVLDKGESINGDPVQLNQVIAEELEKVAEQIQAKDLALESDIDETPMHITAKEAHLRQMLAKLLDNAIRFTPAGGKISVGCRLQRHKILLQISDTGIGIPATDQPQIFKRFFRAGNINLDQYSSGLGLAIVQAIVKNLGGNIWVESEVDQGSTFNILLPQAFT